MRQRIRDARERRDCQKVVPNARDHCEQSKEYFDPSDLGDVTYARPSDGVSGVKDLNGNPIKATFEAFPRAKILAAEIDVSRSTSNRNEEEKSKAIDEKCETQFPRLGMFGRWGTSASSPHRTRAGENPILGPRVRVETNFYVKAEKPEHQARRGHPTLPYRRSAGRSRSRIISCLTKGIEEGQRRRQVRGSHCPLTLSPQPASSLLSQICFRRAAQRSNSLRDTEPGAARAQKCPVERWKRKEQQLLPSSHVLRVTCIHRSNFVAISLR